MLMLTLSANELAFNGADSLFMRFGSRLLQMTAYIGKPAASMSSRISAVRSGSGCLLNIARISAALVSNCPVISLSR